MAVAAAFAQRACVGRHGESVGDPVGERGDGGVYGDVDGRAAGRGGTRLQRKAELTLQIYRILKQRGMTQAEAAKSLGIRQPHVSLLMRNRAGSFSAGRLMEFLTALGQDVEVAVTPSRKQHGEISVTLR